MMFQITPVIMQENRFSATITQGEHEVGAVSKDESTIEIRLYQRLSLQETLELLKVINGMSPVYYQLEVVIDYPNER